MHSMYALSEYDPVRDVRDSESLICICSCILTVEGVLFFVRNVALLYVHMARCCVYVLLVVLYPPSYFAYV